jgi:hypothetical protein
MPGTAGSKGCEGRVRKTVIYLLISLLVGAIGVIVLLLTAGSAIGLSIGTSMAAGGISSIGFALIRYFDDRDQLEQANISRVSADRLSSTVQESIVKVSDLERDIRSMLPEQRVFAAHPRAEIDDLLTGEDPQEVECFGLALGRVRRNHLVKMLTTASHVRLLVSDPRSELFQRTIASELRDGGAAISDILALVKCALAEDKRDIRRASLELRLYPGYPTVTFIRVDSTVLTRPRMPQEYRQSNLFYERYERHQERPFFAYVELFKTLWEESSVADNEALLEIEELARRAS